jgi:hypothetical protein
MSRKYVDIYISRCLNVPMNRPTRFEEGVTTVKTSIEIPEELWRAAKIRAVEQRKNFQDVVAEALREFLKKPKKGGDRVEK